jgi:tRNA uridine 5-carboxymethylaminomethyl modification enzyme
VDIERNRRHEDAPLPLDLDYAAVTGLSNEVRVKLVQHRPQTVAQASRIQGITPAAVSLLLVHLKKTGQLRKAS